MCYYAQSSRIKMYNHCVYARMFFSLLAATFIQYNIKLTDSSASLFYSCSAHYIHLLNTRFKYLTFNHQFVYEDDDL